MEPGISQPFYGLLHPSVFGLEQPHTPMNSIKTLRGFELLDHEGEMAVHVWASNLVQLFDTAARSLYSIIRPSFHLIQPVSKNMTLEEPETDLLLRSFLSELLFDLSTFHYIFTKRHFHRLEPTQLEVHLSGGVYDPVRQPMEREIKAITYYRLRIWNEAPGLHATYLVDV